jgi:hypothetical protein
MPSNKNRNKRIDDRLNAHSKKKQTQPNMAMAARGGGHATVLELSWRTAKSLSTEQDLGAAVQCLS